MRISTGRAKRDATHLARALALFAILNAAACASTRATPEAPVAAAVTQPLDDLNLTGDTAAGVLLRAQAMPYRAPADCASARRELGRLNAALGPHLPSPEAKGGPSDLAGAVIRSVAHLPFRGIVRQLTGAEKREEALRAAVIAGVQRRGYLEGWRAPPRCPLLVEGDETGRVAPPG